jgi:16S rRNA G966 N2-methylase RsmD
MFVVANKIGKYIELNEEAEYSVSRPFQSRQILDFISLNSKKDETILDATACVGGDTIYLAEYFKHVIAIEKNVDNYKLLERNIAKFDFKNITTLNQDCTLYDFNNVDVIYFDPPWGGPGYRSAIDMKLSNISVINLIKKIKKDYPNKNIFLKSPSCFNPKENEELCPIRKAIYSRKGYISFYVFKY